VVDGDGLPYIAHKIQASATSCSACLDNRIARSYNPDPDPEGEIFSPDMAIAKRVFGDT
jgi:hypothetical protein